MNDAVKGQHKREQETKQDARTLCRRTYRSDGLPNGSVVDQEEDSEYGVGIAALSVGHPMVQYQYKGRVDPRMVQGDFHKNLRCDERWPRIDSSRTFPDLIHLVNVGEHDVELIRERYAQNQRYEHRLIESRVSVSDSHTTIATHKELVMGALERIVAF